MIDIDNFKEINDLFGHDLGDDCIKHIAEKGKEIFPSDTFFSRWGGDEFAFIFSGERNELIKTLDEFLTSLNQYSLNETLFLAASIGAAKVDCSNSLNDLVKKADDIMYTAKNKGGNKYLID
jgi:diguanylate cyclase (GGDEF)-like protein